MHRAEILAQFGPRDSVDYDVVIVGAGPSGLAAAIRLKQLAQDSGQDISVCVIEKASEVGAHILSGALMEPRAMSELFPNWQALGAPLNQPVTDDEVLYLTATSSFKTPDALIPDNLRNEGNYIVSLANVVRWMATQAEALGVEIFSGFAAAEVLYGANGCVQGIATGNMGIGKDGEPTSEFQIGMELRAKYTLFAEGARGHLGREIMDRFQLMQGKEPASFSLGIKELWEVPKELAKPGLVVHTVGWPLDTQTFGGGFLYHTQDNKISLGFVTGLDYRNPYLSPFEEMQRWKTHPAIAKHLKGAQRLSYGARAINNGGLGSQPKLVFPGGALIGCNAGMLNAAKIKGSHAAIHSGMLVAQAAFEAITQGRAHDELTAYPESFARSWLYQELKSASNFKLWFKWGRGVGMVMSFVEHWLLPKLGIKTPPWRLHRTQPDHLQLKPANACQPIDYPKPDGVLSFDRLSSVFVSNTHHAENQVSHLTLKDPKVAVAINLARYAGPEARYCPAGVYEFIKDERGQDRLQINAQNCVHCKTCDIKDPTQNIIWIAPEGGGGPQYGAM